jgi:DNA helicase HerA-like ATPase
MNQNSIGDFIGIINQIIDDKTIVFLINSSIKCNINDSVYLKIDENNYAIANIEKIETNYFLTNTNQFFISKAIEDKLQSLNKKENKPRYGQFATASILGIYTFDDDAFTENTNYIDRYTPLIFQEVYRVDFKYVSTLYGLYSMNKTNSKNISNLSVNLGNVVYPFISNLGHEAIFSCNTFSKHTLISGVTGSGKSRLASLIIDSLLVYGAHISILDPHNEYNFLLSDKKEYEIHKISRKSIVNSDKCTINREIGFFEEDLSASTLSSLLPELSEAQKNLLYDIFDSIDEKVTVIKLFDLISKKFTGEVRHDYPKIINELNEIDSELLKNSRNKVEFFEKFIDKIKPYFSDNRSNKTKVVFAVLSKFTELVKKGLIIKQKPNWLMDNSPNTVDIFEIDYSSNEYIRRFINTIIKYFLRGKSLNEERTDILRIFVVDEAHLLLSENSETTNLLKQLLREARKFGIAIIFLTQNHHDIPIDIFSQFQNKFMFRENEFSELKNLKDRTCMVSLYESKLNFAMRVKKFP